MYKYIWRLFLIIFAALTLVACADAPLQFHDPITKWQYVDSYWHHDAKVRVYVPAGQTAKNWQRKITVSYHNNRPPEDITAYEYYLRTVLGEFNAACHGSTADVYIVQQHPGEVVYLYQMVRCSNVVNHATAGKIIATKHGVASIAYLRKTSKLTPTQRKAMLSLVIQAK